MSIEITAQMVKQLREETGAGMMECKKALVEAEGNIEQAVDILRKKGQAKAEKRSGKIAAEGIIQIAVSNDQKAGFMVEVNCETDFVARDSSFRKFVENVLSQGLHHQINDLDALGKLPIVAGSNETIEQERMTLITKIGENVQIRRCVYMKAPGIVGHYNHDGRIGVLVAMERGNAELAKDIAMHIAASCPVAIDPDGIPESVIAKEREIYTAQSQESGKPSDIIAKMVNGRVAKFLKDVCLNSQPFVKNPDQTVASLLQSHNARVIEFVRYEVGEGIEKEKIDFHEEVMAQAKGEKK